MAIHDHTEETSMTLHVAPDGCDGWSGALASPDAGGTDGPLLTIAEARDRIRCVRQAGKLGGPVQVWIHAGIYELRETLVFGEEDLGDEKTPVTYQAAGDGEVVLTGSKELLGGILEGECMAYDLKAEGCAGRQVRQLLRGGRRIEAARYPRRERGDLYGSGWLYVESEDGSLVNNYVDGLGRKDRFICRDPRLKTWTRIDEIELFVYPRHNWTNDIVRLKSYDPDTGEVVLARPAIYEIYPGDRFYFRNVREELEQGEGWVHHRQEDRLYVRLEDADARDGGVSVPVLEQLIEVNGPQPPAEDLNTEKIDWTDQGGWMHGHEASSLAERGYLTFRGLTLEGCDGAGIVMRRVRGCRVADCTVRHTGGAGIVILQGAACEVRDSDIYETGSHGIYASGGLRSPFYGICEPGHHLVENNYIHHPGVFMKSSAGIALNGVGLRAAHNLIHDGPRWGILSRGNDHVIELNHIRHVNIETSDTAAIYLVDRDMTMRGTVIRHNLIHDIPGYWNRKTWPHTMAYGIYLDDLTSRVEVYGNITLRTPSGGLYIHGGAGIVAENNLFLDTEEEAITFSKYREDRELRIVGVNGHTLTTNVCRRNILSSASAEASAYKLVNCSGDVDFPVKLEGRGNVWEQNLVWMTGASPSISLLDGGKKREIPFTRWLDAGYDRGSVTVDPMFVDRASGDYRLSADSPAWALGFEPIPCGKIGIQASSGRRRMPVQEAEGIREHPFEGDHIGLHEIRSE